MSTKGSSTDKCSSSSTLFRGNTALETVNEFLQQLKAKHGEVNLFKALGNDFIYVYGIKSLLKKLDIPDALSEVVDFVVAFEPLFDQIFADFQRKHDAQTKMAPKIDARSKEWNLANESDNCAAQLENAFR